MMIVQECMHMMIALRCVLARVSMHKTIAHWCVQVAVVTEASG